MSGDRRHTNKPSAAHDGHSLHETSAGPNNDWAAIGEITGIFGIHGDLKVAPLTDFPDRFTRTPTVYVGEQHTPYEVTSAREHKSQVVLHLRGLDDPTLAERLRGRRLYIPATELMPLEANQFYLHDVVGMRVEHVNGQPLGTISDVLSAGGTDLFVVRDLTGHEVFLPAVKAFVKDFDQANRVVRVDPIPGLFDDDAVTADPAEE